MASIGLGSMNGIQRRQRRGTITSGFVMMVPLSHGSVRELLLRLESKASA